MMKVFEKKEQKSINNIESWKKSFCCKYSWCPEKGFIPQDTTKHFHDTHGNFNKKSKVFWKTI